MTLQPLSRGFGPEDFVRAEQALAPSYSADGRRIAFLSDRCGVFQVWLIDAAGEAAAPALRVTDTGGVVYAARFRPRHPDQLLYVTDEGGDEQFRLHLLDLASGASRLLAGGPGLIHAFGSWSRDGRRLSFASNRRAREFLDVHVLDVERSQARCVLQADAMHAAGEFAPDGRALLVSRPNHAQAGDNDLLLVTAAGEGTARRLTLHAGIASWRQATFHPSGAILAIADEGREFAGLQRIDAASGRREWLCTPAHDIECFALDLAGSHLALVVNEEGCSQLRAFALTPDARLGAAIDLAAPADGVLANLTWRPDGRALAFTCERPAHPAAVCASELHTRHAARLTREVTSPVARDVLPPPQPVRYPGFAGMQIPAFLYRPRAARGPLPCLVLVHGGPESQSRPALWARWAAPAYLLARGQLALLVPNVRGSTGYGKSYEHADDREHRMDAVGDLVAAHAWLARQPFVDARRIGVMGSSYGGFMTLAAITEAPERWAAAVESYGVVNFETFLANTGPWRRAHRAAEYGEDPTLLRRISPIHRAHRIRTPLLVVQGARDVRVPRSESEQIVEAVRNNGGEVEYLLFQGEGHGIRRIENRLAMAQRVVAFLERYLIGSR